jgi:acyl-CoA synthetase (AMP-forming)/AMP-acid ligase II
MEMHYATIWESIADAIPDAIAIVNGDVERTWAQYDDRAARMAAALTAAGLGPDAKIGMYLYNGNEYLEAQYAGFKLRGVPVNVNYRYLDDELHYLLDNADAEALVFHSSLGDRVARVADRLPKLKLLVQVDDTIDDADDADDLSAAGRVPGAVAYEDLVAAHDPMPRITRHEDDLYMLYTGGTTGMPKGVMYAIGGMTAGFVVAGFPLVGLPAPTDASQVAALARQAYEAGNQIVSVPCAPLMHGTGVWLGAFIQHLAGGQVVTMQSRSLDAHEVLDVTQRRRVTSWTIVGDSFAKPIIRAIDEATERSAPYDTSSIKVVISSGVMWTAEVKEQLLDRVPQAMLVDAIGSTEGSMGVQITMRGMAVETAKFAQMPTTKVFTDDGRLVEPGSDDVGMVAAGGNVPLGYFKDPEKTARTFRVIDGERYSFPGDLAKVAVDGTLILLGRGSQVINTGGEKVYPEEVEEAVKRVDGVLDCLVVGVDDERFGQAVAAVVSTVDGSALDEATVVARVKEQLAGFKAPKRVVFVPQVPRAPNGKADYKTAKHLANDAAHAG